MTYKKLHFMCLRLQNSRELRTELC